MRLFAYSFKLFLFSTLMFSTYVEANSKWRLDKDEEGIKIYLRNTPGSALKSFKSTMTVNRSLSSLLTVIEDTKSYPRWLHNCRSAKLLKQVSETEIVNYVVTDMPWPVADRDAVISASRSQNKSNKRIEIKLRAEPKLLSKVVGKVRIENMHGRWLLTTHGKDKVNVIYEMSIDPGGNIPKWVVNAMAVDLPFYTLDKLRKISKEDKYANAKVKGILD
ncbi:MAG: ribosome-associated toxin RatA of RatAB toxin-antitoxin module [Cocleimonas sp.]|jgi:ribosome-associated toxin RatA of RatAB toxin-antitoxin module